MALSKLTKVQTVGIGSNIEVVGVVTTGQFKSGTSNLHSTGIELTNLNVSGIATIGGNLSVGGVLTYEDVTNIDSIGIITARSGINVSGGQLDVGSNIKIGNAGVITATSFVGSGAGLTGITQTTINTNADNRIITGSGTANTLNGEANLTFDGATLTAHMSAAEPAVIVGDSNRTGAGEHLAEFRGYWDGNHVARIVYAAGDDATNKDDGVITMHTTPSGGGITERLRITSAGRLLIGTSTSNISGSFSSVVSTGAAGNNGGFQVHYDSGSYGGGSMTTVDAAGGGLDFWTYTGNMGSETNYNRRLRIDSNGRLLIGTTTAGWTGYDELTIATSGDTGITIRSGTSSKGQIAFGDGTTGDAEYRGIIRYNHSNDDFFFCTNGDTHRMKIASDIIETGSKTITGGNNLAIQGYAVKGIWSGSPSIGKEIELISGYDSSVKMAAIGYNLTDVNTGSTYGGDLVFHTQPLYSSPTTPLPERMRISSTGYVTKSVVPCWNLRPRYNSTQTTANTSSHHAIGWGANGTANSNFLQNCSLHPSGFTYNIHNGQNYAALRVPVAGRYYVNCTYRVENNPTQGNIYVYVNSSQIARQHVEMWGHRPYMHCQYASVLNLAKNDEIIISVSCGNANISGYNDNVNWFSGYLIG